MEVKMEQTFFYLNNKLVLIYVYMLLKVCVYIKANLLCCYRSVFVCSPLQWGDLEILLSQRSLRISCGNHQILRARPAKRCVRGKGIRAKYEQVK